MCKLGIVAALLCTSAASLPAQEAARWRDTATRVEAEYRALRDSMVQGDSTVRDVARSGDLVVGASDDLRRIAQRALDRIVSIRKRWFGGRFPSEAGFRIVIRSQAGDDPTRAASMVVLSGLPDSGSAPRMDRSVPRSQIEATLVDVFGEMMLGVLSPTTREWLDGGIPLSMSEQEREHLVMYAVATGTGNSQRACLSGSVADCRYALGLGSPPREAPGNKYAAFLRGDLLLHALELGPDSWERFRSSTAAEPMARLAEASGLPPDSLIRRWFQSTLSSRPTHGPIETGAGLSALGWIGLLLFAALFGGRSRWV